MLRSQVAGHGSYLPKKILTNRDLAEMVDTSDEWIASRTGIRQRHIAAEGERTSDLATAAGRAAMTNAGVEAKDIGLVIVATTTPDFTLPATANLVQHRLGIGPEAASFDMQAACSGFIYALAVADKFITAGAVRHALVIGAETYSRIIDWKDRSVCILFGDGAGALVLSAVEGKGDTSDRGILHTNIHADGSLSDLLITSGGVSSTGEAGLLHMAGKEVFRHAVEKMAACVEEGLQALHLPKESVDWVVPHQANWRILTATAKKIGLNDEKIIASVEKHANTSAASIPLALDMAANDGRIQPGQLLALPALGAGLTWGCSLLRW